MAGNGLSSLLIVTARGVGIVRCRDARSVAPVMDAVNKLLRVTAPSDSVRLVEGQKGRWICATALPSGYCAGWLSAGNTAAGDPAAGCVVLSTGGTGERVRSVSARWRPTETQNSATRAATVTVTVT